MASTPTYLARGLTPTEQNLARLCNQTFLSLWSFPNVYHNQGIDAGAGAGKELCDLLVVFDDDVIIFSVKECAVTQSGDTETDWRRWYQRAIVGNTNQIKGAERHIKLFPGTLFLDPACSQPFPLPIPDLRVARYHRIIVAHGATERIRQEFGGLGSLRIKPDITGQQHIAPIAEGGEPFTVGQVDPDFGYIHVLDDVSLDAVMEELDTISDFVAYLNQKEQLIVSETLADAASELDLLADYLCPLEEKFKRAFTIPGHAERLSVPPGLWDGFNTDGFRKRRKEEDSVSYLWDRVIEESSKHILAGTLAHLEKIEVAEAANALRWMAREDRFHRRYLARWIIDAIDGSEVTAGNRMTRSTVSDEPGSPVFTILLLASNIPGMTSENYGEARRMVLHQVLEVTKLKHPDAQHVIGIATDMHPNQFRSQDIAYRDFSTFSEVDRKRARRIARDMGFLRKIRRGETTYAEYPHPTSQPLTVPFFAPVKPVRPRNEDEALRPKMKGAERNHLCPCGSGRKYKRCCGKLAT